VHSVAVAGAAQDSLETVHRRFRELGKRKDLVVVEELLDLGPNALDLFEVVTFARAARRAQPRFPRRSPDAHSEIRFSRRSV
jgi:hypothetical protein